MPSSIVILAVSSVADQWRFIERLRLIALQHSFYILQSNLSGLYAAVRAAEGFSHAVLNIDEQGKAGRIARRSCTVDCCFDDPKVCPI